MSRQDPEISVHLIFGRNLRILCQERGTIAKNAEDLGISRVQINRILNGESFPKPGLLRRICDLYNVDSRVLLEPLSRIRQCKNVNSIEPQKDGIFDKKYFDHLPFLDETSHAVLSDGIHLMAQSNDMDANLYSIALLQIKTRIGHRFIRGVQAILE